MNRIFTYPGFLRLPVFFFIISFAGLCCNNAPAANMYTIGFSQCTGFDNWRKTMFAEMKRELSFHDNIKFIYKDANGNSEEQIKQIEEFVDENIDLLIVSPNEVKPLSPIIQKVFDSGIPVVVVDRRTDSKKYTAFIGASNFEVGQNAGRYAAAILKGRGNVMEVTGIPDASPVIDRHNGFIDIISDYPAIKYVARINNYTGVNNNTDPVEKYLKTVGNVDLIYAQNDFMAFDIYKICRNTGLENKIKIIGIDGLPLKGEGLDMVENKFISATVLYPTGGQEAVLTAVNILEHKPYNKENHLFTTIIDSTNIRITKLQLEKVLAQQKDIDRSNKKIEDLAVISRSQTNIIYTISISLAIAMILGLILFYYLKENKKINARLALQNEEILSQRNQLIELSREAKEATDAKINFFLNISHEFRTPLTLILGPLDEMMNNSRLNFTTKQYLSLIQKNTIRLLRLINELIDFRKIEVNKMQLRASEIDLVAFTNDITGTFDDLAKKRKIDLRVITKEPGILMWFDTVMMDKVLFNLLSNAFKFTGDHGVIHIILEKNNELNLAVIKVEDNGIGMSQDVIDHAFELFYQADISNRQGSGLGLSLSKELINLHHGSITVTSKQWKGTCFEITLLLGTAHFEENEIQKEKPSNEVMYYDERIYSTELEKPEPEKEENVAHDAYHIEYTVLIIEDNADLRNFLADKLRKEYQVIVADNGNTALQQAFDNVPDLIIADVILPGKDGIYLTNKLKNDIRTSHIPIILLTAKSEIGEQIEGMKNRADAYIVKPFNIQFLEETIKSVMKNRMILREHYTSELSLSVKSQNPKKLDRKFINEFTAIIESNIGNERFSVDDLSHALGISRVQLYRKVKALLGYNINDFILNTRLQKARHYLNEGGLSISEISYKVGFASPAYFSTVFKSKFAITPSEYKEKNKA